MAMNYRERRRSRRVAHRTETRRGVGRLEGADSRAGAPVKLVAVETWNWPTGATTGSPLSVVVRGRYEVRVVDGFASTTLVQVVRALEQV